MALNYIWVAFFLIAFVVAIGETLIHGNLGIWSEIMNSSFSAAGTAFEISIGLTGILALWLGLMKIGERAGVIQFFGKLVSPFFSRLFPEIPKGNPAMGSIFMNVSANMLGLDNAATPLGLKAMKELQQLNPHKDTASNSMLMFLILNASGLCIIPIGVMMYRAQGGAANPTDVFMPILISTFVSTLVGVIALCIKQKISILNRTMLSWLISLSAIIIGIVWYLSTLPQTTIQTYSAFAANFILFSVIIGFLLSGLVKRVNMFDSFVEGAKDGFTTAVSIIPYLVAFLVGIAIFRASGAMQVLTDGIAAGVNALGFDSEWVGALPTMLMKPLSGSGSRGMMIDAMNTYGVDSLIARISACVQGSTDTTFYILAVYFGAVGIKKTRYAVPYALLADIVGSIAGVLTAYLFFAD